jgi:drug/metabolite transporter superfamily protein YnfA
MVNFILPSDILTSFIKFLPFLFLTIVLIYGTYDVVRLLQNNKPKDACKLAAIVILLLAVAMIVTFFTFDIGVRYVL